MLLLDGLDKVLSEKQLKNDFDESIIPLNKENYASLRKEIKTAISSYVEYHKAEESIE